jgi:hypothetical protein
MTTKDNIFYIFIEELEEKCVLKFVQDSDWKIKFVAGSPPDDIESYSNHENIGDIMEDLRNKYDYVEEISFNDIDDYIS